MLEDKLRSTISGMKSGRIMFFST